jgi:hypothetical protein
MAVEAAPSAAIRASLTLPMLSAMSMVVVSALITGALTETDRPLWRKDVV